MAYLLSYRLRIVLTGSYSPPKSMKKQPRLDKKPVKYDKRPNLIDLTEQFHSFQGIIEVSIRL